MRVALRLDQIEKRMNVMSKYGGIHTPVIYDPKNPDLFFVNGVEMTKAELDKLREEDNRDGMVIFMPKRLDAK